mmetsp:Transcript_152999/g.388757  ORF Transcript_152999/g.388757 Transcript_152999/m.388757 type:complete len:213 (-) Transcript_152999:852-1490(-)
MCQDGTGEPYPAGSPAQTPQMQVGSTRECPQPKRACSHGLATTIRSRRKPSRRIAHPTKIQACEGAAAKGHDKRARPPSTNVYTFKPRFSRPHPHTRQGPSPSQPRAQQPSQRQRPGSHQPEWSLCGRPSPGTSRRPPPHLSIRSVRPAVQQPHASSLARSPSMLDLPRSKRPRPRHWQPAQQRTPHGKCAPFPLQPQSPPLRTRPWLRGRP